MTSRRRTWGGREMPKKYLYLLPSEWLRIFQFPNFITFNATLLTCVWAHFSSLSPPQLHLNNEKASRNESWTNLFFSYRLTWNTVTHRITGPLILLFAPHIEREYNGSGSQFSLLYYYYYFCTITVMDHISLFAGVVANCGRMKRRELSIISIWIERVSFGTLSSWNYRNLNSFFF